MKRQTYLPLLCLWLTSASALFSAPIQNLKFTDVVKDVKILNVATKAETTAPEKAVLWAAMSVDMKGYLLGN